ncbi:WXG100 family type VII secretion target [Brachybacterium sp. Z12]|uniref:WXG100 family type VII secretion target n=1 Tax=Brachybacterium sp. Z12 TaxID=2759167 RepID=UPI0018601C04|nr:WXG100 family type VII secretion target [Brachybacterium sp. Z12]QNN82197.1 WXG100 family type VII secretion target [Brachybacterium sp. Z12]
MEFVGMDTGQGREHAERLRTAAQRLGSEHAVLSSTVQASEAFWRGPDAEAFRSTWADGAGRLLHQLVGELEESASVLDGDVEEQESASAGEPTGGPDAQGDAAGALLLPRELAMVVATGRSARRSPAPGRGCRRRSSSRFSRRS